MQFQNPGPWSFAVFAVACALAGAMVFFKVPDGPRFAGMLVGLVAAWLAKPIVAAGKKSGGAS